MDALFQIEPENGALKFAPIPLTLTPKQPVSTFLATDAGARAQDLGGDDRRQRYYIRHDLGNGRRLGATLFFLDSRLVEVRIGYGAEREFDWAGWSESRELAKAEEYQREIVRQLGRRGRFPWGVADAVYDEKAAHPVLFVKYGSE